MIDLDDLEAKARAATPGPWEWERRGPDGATLSLMRPMTLHGKPVHPLNLVNTQDDEWDWNKEANRAHIAAANPAAILELVAEVRRLREALEDIRDEGANNLDDYMHEVRRMARAALEPEPDGE